MNPDTTNSQPPYHRGLTAPKFFVGLAFIALAAFIATLIVNGTTQLVAPRIDQSISSVVTNKGSAFNVTGEAKIEAVPDQAQINLGITANADTVKAAQDQVNQVINNFTTALNSIGIEKKDIQTSNYSLYPRYDYSDASQGRRILGYTASTSITVTVQDFSKVNQVIDLATNAGINEINGLNFTLSKEKEAEVKQAARVEAIDNAKLNAADLSNLTGMKLGKIIDVQENNYNSAVPMAAYNYDYALKEVSTGGTTDIQAGSTTYTYNVTLSYETL